MMLKAKKDLVYYRQMLNDFQIKWSKLDLTSGITIKGHVSIMVREELLRCNNTTLKLKNGSTKS